MVEDRGPLVVKDKAGKSKLQAAGRLIKTIAQNALTAVFASVMTGLFVVLTLLSYPFIPELTYPSEDLFSSITFFALPALLVGALAFLSWQAVMAREEAVEPPPKILRRAFLALTLLGLGFAGARFVDQGITSLVFPALWATYALIALTASLSDREPELEELGEDVAIGESISDFEGRNATRNRVRVS